MVDVLVPVAAMLAGDGEIVECDGATACATVIVTSCVTLVGVCGNVARTVDVPFATAVATPVIGSIVTDVPAKTDQRSDPFGIGLPAAFFTVALNVTVWPNDVSVGAGDGVATIDVAAFVTVMKIESRLSGSPGLTALMNTPPGPTAVIVPSPSPDTVAMVASALLHVTEVRGSATPRPLRKSTA